LNAGYYLTSKLNKLGYGLMIFGGIVLGFALLAYWQSLLPAGCVLCPPREYAGAIFFFTVVGIIFVTIGALVKYADWEQKKALRQRS